MSSLHMQGWVDAMLKIIPPLVAERDYIDGYREGARSRLHTLNVKCRNEEIRIMNAVAMTPAALLCQKHGHLMATTINHNVGEVKYDCRRPGCEHVETRALGAVGIPKPSDGSLFELG